MTVNHEKFSKKIDEMLEELETIEKIAELAEHIKQATRTVLGEEKADA